MKDKLKGAIKLLNAFQQYTDGSMKAIRSASERLFNDGIFYRDWK